MSSFDDSYDENQQDVSQQAMDMLSSSGAINHLSSKLFSEVAKYSNENKASSMLASHAKMPETTPERLAARLVYEYLSHRNLIISLDTMKSEFIATSVLEQNTNNSPSSPNSLFNLLSFKHKSHLLKQLVSERTGKDSDLNEVLHNSKGRKLKSRTIKTMDISSDSDENKPINNNKSPSKTRSPSPKKSKISTKSPTSSPKRGKKQQSPKRAHSPPQKTLAKKADGGENEGGTNESPKRNRLKSPKRKGSPQNSPKGDSQQKARASSEKRQKKGGSK